MVKVKSHGGTPVLIDSSNNTSYPIHNVKELIKALRGEIEECTIYDRSPKVRAAPQADEVINIKGVHKETDPNDDCATGA